MTIQILGTGCTRCKELKAMTKKAVEELSLPAEIVAVTDSDAIMEMGALLTPALAINGAVKSAGKVLTTSQIKNLLQKENQNDS